MRTQDAIEFLEFKRRELQCSLDIEKTQQERNQLGQFSTPPSLAEDLLVHAKSLLPNDTAVRFIDPAIGTGAFYSALLKTFPSHRIESAQGFELDPHYGLPSAQLWTNTKLKLDLADFTRQKPRPCFNLLICNPPYVRHHHLSNSEKTTLQGLALQASGTKLSGLAGLYCHFLLLSHAWLELGAISGWLVPSEFMNVNYGQALRKYLLRRVTLLHIHRFDPRDVQFADALVSSAIVWFRNAPPPEEHCVKFTFGGTLEQPKITKTLLASDLAREEKWTRFPVSEIRRRLEHPKLSDYFKVKRGLATGNNRFFMLSAEEIDERKLPKQCFRPILPSPRYVTADEIDADEEGDPLLTRKLFLLDTNHSEEHIRRHFPSLWNYLEEGKSQGLHERYLCSKRNTWYAQEVRPAPPIACTYLGRGDAKNGRPFRFILNNSNATVANVYLAMYPTAILTQAMARDPQLIRKVWKVLNRLTPDRLLSEGRVYGGGLHKLEPKELANVSVPEIAGLFPGSWNGSQIEMFPATSPSEL